MSDSEILDYHNHIRLNRDIFLLTQRDAFDAFATVHGTFTDIGKLLASRRDKSGGSHTSLIPFLLLMQRQAQSAFWAFVSYQSYQAWVTLRPCVEAALMVGKFASEPATATIWIDREQNPTAFRKEFQGKALAKNSSLPRAETIQQVLRNINDDFMHTNEQYYRRHLEEENAGPDHVNLEVHYFDLDKDEHRAHVLAFLHLMVVVEDSLCTMFNAIFEPPSPLNAALDTFEGLFQPKAEKLAAEVPGTVPVLQELGLWQFNPGT